MIKIQGLKALGLCRRAFDFREVEEEIIRRVFATVRRGSAQISLYMECQLWVSWGGLFFHGCS